MNIYGTSSSRYRYEYAVQASLFSFIHNESQSKSVLVCRLVTLVKSCFWRVNREYLLLVCIIDVYVSVKIVSLLIIRLRTDVNVPFHPSLSPAHFFQAMCKDGCSTTFWPRCRHSQPRNLELSVTGRNHSKIIPTRRLGARSTPRAGRNRLDVELLQSYFTPVFSLISAARKRKSPRIFPPRSRAWRQESPRFFFTSFYSMETRDLCRVIDTAPRVTVPPLGKLCAPCSGCASHG